METGGIDSVATTIKDIRTVINVDHVSMVFNIANQKLNSLKEYFVAIMKRELMFKEFRALNDITFEIEKGDVFGILGVNGSGKSTLLKIIAGILKPTSGHVSVHGRIAPLIELGAGFDPELTARENIFLNGALLGYSKDFIEEKFDEIVEFAEVEKFLDMPLKNYSSGMVSRVAFAIATVVVPDILICDEVLSVGDFMFRKKCEERIQELIDKHGTTILLVSHSDSQIERLCNKALWIDKSNMRMIGSAKDVARMYRMMGGRAGSAESEKLIQQILQRTLQLPDEHSFNHVGDNSYAINRAVVSLQTKELDARTVILVPTAQLEAQLLAITLGKHIDAPVVLTSTKDLVPANASFIRDLNPEEIIIIDHRDEEADSNLEASIKVLTGITPIMLCHHDIFDLSLSIMEYGNGIHSWGRPLVVDVKKLVSFSLTCSRMNTDDSPIIFVPSDMLVETAVERLKTKYPTSSPIVFGIDSNNEDMRLEDGFASPFGKLQAINAMGIDRNRGHGEPSHSVVITSPQPDLIFTAIQHASEQRSHIVLYDNKNFDEIIHALEIIDSLRPIDQVTFINQNSFFSELDQRLITNVAHGGLQRCDP